MIAEPAATAWVSGSFYGLDYKPLEMLMQDISNVKDTRFPEEW